MGVLSKCPDSWANPEILSSLGTLVTVLIKLISQSILVRLTIKFWRNTIQPSLRWFRIVTEAICFARKYMRGLIMLLIIVITMPTGRTLSKPTRASHERVKKLCGENQYNASSNFTFPLQTWGKCAQRGWKCWGPKWMCKR